jgi:hypothetical protein
LDYLERFLFKEKQFINEKNKKRVFMDDTESNQFASVKDVFGAHQQGIFVNL